MGPCFGTILRLAKKNRHTKVICIADNVIPHEKRFGDKPFTKYFIPPVDAFITMSIQVLADLRSFTKSAKAEYVPHPLYDNFGDKISMTEARHRLNIEPATFLLLFFGFIRKYKGLDLLLEALAMLGDNIPHLKLLVAGEFYGDQKEYAAQIERLGVHDKLILHNEFIADAAIRNYFCAADVVVQPYRHATQSGVTPLAYHFETPMIVTNVGGLPALVPDGIVGLIAEPTPASLASKILEFYQTGSSHFIPGLVQEKKKYSWKVMTDTIIRLARDV
jgi:glycosyltransferase involved in cell wall biosynthesis